MEFVDVDPSDTVEDVRIKITMLFMGLDPEAFAIYTNSGKQLNNKEVMRNVGPVEYL